MSSKRENEFPEKIKIAAMLRQQYKCAFCGKALITQPTEAHHVIPAKLGRHIVIDNAFVMSLNNCVALHKDCHLEDAHSGNYAHGPLLDAVAFRYSHGGNTLAHQQWVFEHDKIWAVRLLPRK